MRMKIVTAVAVAAVTVASAVALGKYAGYVQALPFEQKNASFGERYHGIDSVEQMKMPELRKWMTDHGVIGIQNNGAIVPLPPVVAKGEDK